MLLFEGNTSHVNKSFLLRCLDYRVLPVCLPPHTTNLLQPLDVSVFSPLKRAYSDILQEKYAKGERAVWKGNFYKLLNHAQQVAFTPENIYSGFRATGLCPVDFSIIRQKLRMSDSESPAAYITSTVDSNSEHQAARSPAAACSPAAAYLPAATRSSTSAVCSRSLDSLTATEVYAIETPRNPRTLHQLYSAMATELSNSNSPRSWRLRHTLDKMRNCGSSALHERDFLQDRLDQHKGSSEPTCNPRRRQVKPSEGHTFKNKDEINAHFAARDAADKARTDERICKAKERITKLQDVIDSLSKKMERHLARLEKDGRLPAKWRTPQRLEEDIYKERTKLEKAMQEIAFLESDLQDQPLVLQDGLEGGSGASAGGRGRLGVEAFNLEDHRLPELRR